MSRSAKEYTQLLSSDGESGIRSPAGESINRRTGYKSTQFLYALSFFAALGGFLFGYDTGVVSGAMLKVAKQFELAAWQEELLVSITIAAAAVASAFGGALNNVFGRRPVLVSASLVFTAGAVIMAVATQWVILLLGRLIVGIGIGFASLTVPMYIGEAAPVHVRGRLITVNNLFITGGQFIASVVDGAFADVSQGWRYMLGLGAVPSFIQFVGFLFLPESPRWLVRNRKSVKAKNVLQRIRGEDANIEDEFMEIQSECLASKQGEQDGALATLARILRSAPVRRALLIGCLLQACQQLSGINTLMYYSATIIKMAGVEKDSEAIWLAAAVALGNFVFTVVGVYLVERSGRRKLLLGSLAGVILSLIFLSSGFLVARLQTPSVVNDPLLTDNSSCAANSNCYSCSVSSNCGFCYIKGGGFKALNGSCQAVWRNSHGRMDREKSGWWNSSFSNYSPDVSCVPALAEYNADVFSPDKSSDVVWAYDYCPTRYAWLTILGLVIYIALFAPGMGPMPWTINAELYPSWARSTCNAMATAVNWICNLIISMTFLTISESRTVGRAGAFGIYAVIALICWVILYFTLPETKGRPLEKAEELFARPGDKLLGGNEADQYA